MDVENILKELRRAERYCLNDYSRMAGQAATAISTLQDENAQLQAELEQKEKYYEQMVDALAATESAELEQVKAERDVAVKAIERVRSCKDCGYYTGEWTPPCKECQDSEEHHPYFKWRGPHKED